MTTEFNITLLDSYLGDIFGLQNATTGEEVKKGLLKQKLKASTKQHLKILAREITKEKKTYEDSVQELKNEYFEGATVKEGKSQEDYISQMLELNKTKVSITHFDFKSAEDVSNLVCEEDYVLLELVAPVE